MASLDEVNRLLWLGYNVAACVLLARLWREHLLQTYPTFSVFLFWQVVSSAIASLVTPNTNAYGVTYTLVSAVDWVLFVATSLELMRSVFRRYPGVTILGSRVLLCSLTIGIAIALISIVMGVNYGVDAPAERVRLMTVFLLGRIVCLSVLVFLFIGSSFLLWFPVPLPANAIRFLLGYTAMFAARTLSYFLLTTQGLVVTRIASAVSMAASLACIVYWIVRLHAAGERTEIQVGAERNPELEARLLAQIDAINARVAGTSRK